VPQVPQWHDASVTYVSLPSVTSGVQSFRYCRKLKTTLQRYIIQHYNAEESIELSLGRTCSLGIFSGFYGRPFLRILQLPFGAIKNVSIASRCPLLLTWVKYNGAFDFVYSKMC